MNSQAAPKPSSDLPTQSLGRGASQIFGRPRRKDLTVFGHLSVFGGSRDRNRRAAEISRLATNLQKILASSVSNAEWFIHPPAQLNPKPLQKGNAMQCVNPQCRQDAHDLYSGTLRLFELTIPPEERIVRADGGFPVVVVPSRFFWLCSQCSRIWRMKRWTTAGLLLEPNRPGNVQQHPSHTVKVPLARQASMPRLQVRSHRVA